MEEATGDSLRRCQISLSSQHQVSVATVRVEVRGEVSWGGMAMNL